MSVEFFLLTFAPGASFLLGLYLGSWYLRRAVRELQYGLADLEDRLIREVKRRAVATRWEVEAADKEKLSEELKAEVGKSFLKPAEFIARKWGGRTRGAQP